MLKYTDGDGITVELLNVCASDLMVVNAARVSFDKFHEAMEQGDDKLIGWLMRKRHGTPFEQNFFEFRVHCPIFVVREHHRHRIGHSYNEVSGRYVELKPEFYVPHVRDVRTRIGKPGDYHYEPLPQDTAEEWIDELMKQYERAWRFYQWSIEMGVALEQARIALPVGLFTTFIWSCNARSLMHYIGLRGAPDAMREIRTVSEAAQLFLAEHMPITHAAFIDNGAVAP